MSAGCGCDGCNASIQDNERLQKEKTAAERKLQRLAHRLGLQRGAGAAIGGDSTASRAEQMERQV